MSIKTKLGRLEKSVAERTTVVSCPECGETVRDFGDLALKVLVADWREATGQPEHAPDPALDRVLAHPHPGLVKEVLRDLPSFASCYESESG